MIEAEIVDLDPDFRRESVLDGDENEDYLLDTYDYLRALADSSVKRACNPFDEAICNAVYGSYRQVARVKALMRKLDHLGYISVRGSGSNREIRIARDLDQ